MKAGCFPSRSSKAQMGEMKPRSTCRVVGVLGNVLLQMRFGNMELGIRSRFYDLENPAQGLEHRPLRLGKTFLAESSSKSMQPSHKLSVSSQRRLE
jgi:hypothetical protein